jgi:uncharacterized protein
MGSMDCGEDLAATLARVCVENGICCGDLQAIGAVRKACVGYYDQDRHEYQFQTVDKHMEIVNLSGNISLKDGRPFVHAHITLVDENDKFYGGHLAEETEVFACEFVIREFRGQPPARRHDSVTGLTLW